ncbi:prostaglandin-E(2) 9-reductase [Biomphalaria pfeifferi]|uniref:Prostaglandin-E(2) 9-reductase n=1 Tax=Biomphalaria pfeifferi TaxID=112525 RepID=A0AAD8BIR5_BIOPF|nr:prostaglandin-E(2) 9-reductase [Biomphalaria pfeifferi]
MAKKYIETERIRLSSGRQIPVLGLGTCAPLQSEEEIIEAVKSALRSGYRHIDCAAIYRNERAVGHALKEAFVMGIVKREDLFITSKLWNTCHKPELVLPSLKKTLDDLGLEYLDLYLMHWPMAYKEGGEMNPLDENGKAISSDVDYIDTWQRLMEKLKVEASLTRIKTEVWLIGQLQDVLPANVLPTTSDVLKVFCYHHHTEKKTVSESAKLTSYQILELWDKARIPTTYDTHVIEKLKSVFEEYQLIKKNKGRASDAQRLREKNFEEKSRKLFDIAHQEAAQLIKIHEDRVFLEDQRSTRQMKMSGIVKR